MTRQIQLLCAWSGPAFLVVFGIGWLLLAGFLPAPSPSLSATAVAEIYQQHTVPIRLGIFVLLAGTGLLAPWTAVISTQMRRIEGNARELSYTQLLAGGAGIMLFFVPELFWAIAAFRPERDPQLTQIIHDAAWLSFLAPAGAVIIQCLAIGIAILSDKSAEPIFPRWVGFFNLWCVVLFAPGPMAILFKTGPFAWNGLFPFWIPLGVFSIWFGVMLISLIKAINSQVRT